MPPPHDILIVGAGPAGCAVAYDLARAGKRVLLLDRRSFPRPKACACGLTRKTLRALRYSVEPVIERSCREVVLQEAGPRFAEGARVADKASEVRLRSGKAICAMAVRERFDAFCLERTLEVGAELVKIDSLIAVRESSHAVQLEVALADGSPQTFTAAVLIGADGSNGQTRRIDAGLAAQRESLPAGGWIEVRTAALPSEPPWYTHGFALEAMVPFPALPSPLPAGDAPDDFVFDFAPIAGGYGWLFPKGDHINIGVGGFVPKAKLSEGDAPDVVFESATRGRLERYAREKLGVELNAVQAHVSGQHLGLGGHAYVPSGRVLLAGDAAGLVDPLTGEGIHSAITSGQAAAKAILSSNLESAQIAAAYIEELRELQRMLQFSSDAAKAFYREPGRGFRVVRKPLLRQLMLKTYADGIPFTKLLSALRIAMKAA